MAPLNWRTARFVVDLSRPQVMAIVNLTPDSFTDGGRAPTIRSAMATCERLLADGADILDLGAESSRPGATPVDDEVELARLLPVLGEAVRLGCPISVDTRKPAVMRAALDLGADIVNDIDALRAPAALDVVAAHGACGVCLMHMRGTPSTMHEHTDYGDVVAEVAAFLGERRARLGEAGIAHDRIVVDPGIGFAKTAAQNLALLARQRELAAVGAPLLVGWSRKSTLARLVGLADVPAARRTSAQWAALDAASASAALLAVERGASIVRVHDVASTVAALAIRRAAAADNPSPPTGPLAGKP